MNFRLLPCSHAFFLILYLPEQPFLMQQFLETQTRTRRNHKHKEKQCQPQMSWTRSIMLLLLLQHLIVLLSSIWRSETAGHSLRRASRNQNGPYCLQQWRTQCGFLLVCSYNLLGSGMACLCWQTNGSDALSKDIREWHARVSCCF